MVGPQWYGFYPINHGILRIHGKYRPSTKKLQTTQYDDFMSSACLLKLCLITPSRAEFSEERSHFLQFSILYCTLLIFHQWEYNCGVSPARLRSSQPSSPCSGLCLSPPWRSAQPPPPPWSATTVQTGPSLSRAPATTSPPSQSTGSRLRRWVNMLLPLQGGSGKGH